MITLQIITEENFEEVIALDAGDNDRFIERNVYSIAEAKIIPEYIVEAIYDKENLIGFVMYKFDADKNRIYINRLMIDIHYQNNGFGSMVMKLFIKIAKDKGMKSIVLHVHPQNLYAISFYKKVGFIDTGRVNGGENEYELSLK